MYKYFKIRLRTHKIRIKFYLLLQYVPVFDVCFVLCTVNDCRFCGTLLLLPRLQQSHYSHTMFILFCYRQASHIQFLTCLEILEPIKGRLFVRSFVRSLFSPYIAPYTRTHSFSLSEIRYDFVSLFNFFFLWILYRQFILLRGARIECDPPIAAFVK